MVAPIGMSPAGAAGAYARVQAGGAPPDAAGFSGTLSRALQGMVDAGKQADAQSAGAIAGTGNLTDTVTAVARAELSLQTAVAVRDRVVQAYQEIMRMPI